MDINVDKPKAIIFDFDQTLLDLFPNKQVLFVLKKRIREYYSKYLPINANEKDNLELDYSPYWEYIELVEKNFSPSRAKKINAKAEKIVLNFEFEEIKGKKFYADVNDTIKSLSNEYILGIASNNGITFIEKSLKKVGLNKYFSAIGGRSFPCYLRDQKPETKYLCDVKNALNLTPHDVVYFVGDRPTDMEVAKKMGWVAVGVLTGDFDKASLLESGADHIMNCLSDLNAVLSNNK